MTLLLVILVLVAINVDNNKTHFPDGQTGRTEYTIQINFEENLLTFSIEHVHYMTQ